MADKDETPRWAARGSDNENGGQAVSCPSLPSAPDAKPVVTQETDAEALCSAPRVPLDVCPLCRGPARRKHVLHFCRTCEIAVDRDYRRRLRHIRKERARCKTGADIDRWFLRWAS